MVTSVGCGLHYLEDDRLRDHPRKSLIAVVPQGRRGHMLVTEEPHKRHAAKGSVPTRSVGRCLAPQPHTLKRNITVGEVMRLVRGVPTGQLTIA